MANHFGMNNNNDQQKSIAPQIPNVISGTNPQMPQIQQTQYPPQISIQGARVGSQSQPNMAQSPSVPSKPGKKKSEDDGLRQDINVIKMNTGMFVMNSRVDPTVFGSLINCMCHKCNADINEQAKLLILMALKIRMTDVVKTSVFFSQYRRNKVFPANSVCTDFPLQKFAMLNAERIMIENRYPINFKNDDSTHPIIKQSRNQLIYGLAARLSDKKQEDLVDMVKETPECESKDIDELNQLLPKSNKNPLVTIEDVYAFIETDMITTPFNRESITYSLQVKKIERNANCRH